MVHFILSAIALILGVLLVFVMGMILGVEFCAGLIKIAFKYWPITLLILLILLLV